MQIIYVQQEWLGNYGHKMSSVAIKNARLNYFLDLKLSDIFLPEARGGENLVEELLSHYVHLFFPVA